MVLSTPAKVVSGVAAASTAVVGSTLAYKYATGLYAIEKYAMDEGVVWKVKSETNSNIVTVSATATTGELSNKYGVSNGWSWTCKLNLNTSKSSDINGKLKKYFGVDAISSDEKDSTSIIFENRVGFVNSCSSNRKNSNNKELVSEINIGQYNIDSELEAIFGRNLNPVEIKVYSSSDIDLKVSEFTVDSNNKKVTGTITASNKTSTTTQIYLSNEETWTCTIEGIVKDGTDLTSGENTGNLKTTLSGKLTSESDKWGLVNSCARHRTNNFGDKKVTSIIKLNVLKNGDPNQLKFEDSQITSVFKGTWINL